MTLFQFLISHFVLDFLPAAVFGMILAAFLGFSMGAKFFKKISPPFSRRFLYLGISVLVFWLAGLFWLLKTFLEILAVSKGVLSFIIWSFSPPHYLVPSLGLFLVFLAALRFSSKKPALFSSRSLVWGILVLAAARLVKAGLEFYGTYFLWKADPVSVHLLPPENTSYFFGYGWQHFLKDDVFIFASAVGLFCAIYFINRFFGERFFYPEEPYLAALATLTLGWPNWFLFMMLVFVPALLFHLGRISYLTGVRKVKEPDFRLSFLYFWLPAALVVWVWGGRLAQFIGLTEFKI